jgi:hypothetical protein
MNNKIKLSAVTSAAILSATLFVGCGSDSISGALSSIGKVISGKAIDGYINGATVEFGGKTVTTNTSGSYSFTFDSEPTATNMKVSGGIDVSTGEVFEGQLSSYVPAGASSANITPLTTIVAAEVQRQVDLGTAVVDINVAGVKSTIATNLGIDETMLDADIIAEVTSGSNKAAAATAIKQALVVQKAIEAYSKAAAGSSDATAIQSNSAAIFAKVAQDLATTGQTIDTALAATNVSTAFTGAAALKVTAAQTAVQSIQNEISAIDVNDLVSSSDVLETLSAQSKAIEFISSRIEDQLAVTTVNAATLNEAVVSNALLGGVSAVTATIEQAIENNTDETQTVTIDALQQAMSNKITAAENLATTILTTGTTTISDINLTAIAADVADNNGTINASVITSSVSTISTDLNVSALNDANISTTITETIKTDAEIAAELLAMDVAIDKLALKDNQITIGDTTVTITDGSFGEVNHDLVTDGNYSALYSTSFALADLSTKEHGLEDGNSTVVTLGISIKNTENNQRLFVVMNKIQIEKTNGDDSDNNYDGEYQATVLDGATLNGYATKADGTTISTSIQNNTANGPVVTTDGAISYDFTNAINEFKSMHSEFDDLEVYFNTKAKYEVRLFITSDAAAVAGSFDGVINTKNATNITGDQNLTSVENAYFSNPTFEISGKLNVGYTPASLLAEDAANLEVLGNSNDSNITLNTDMTLDVIGANNSPISWSSDSSNLTVDSSGALTIVQKLLTAQTITLTATITGTEDTTTKVFRVVIPALTNAEIVAMAKEDLTLTSASDGTMLVNNYSNTDLSADALVQITWTEDSNDVNITNGYYVDNLGTTVVTDVNFTATLDRNGTTDTKVFTLSVAPSDADAFAYDTTVLKTTMANYTNIAYDQDMSALRALTSLTAGSTVSWESNNTNIMSNNFTIIPSAVSQSVTMNATVSKGESSNTIDYVITIAADPDMAAVLAMKTGYDNVYNNLFDNNTIRAEDINASGYFNIDLNTTNATWSGSSASIATTTEEQTVSYTATFENNDYNDTSTYTYTIPADANRSVTTNSVISLKPNTDGTVNSENSITKLYTVNSDDEYSSDTQLIISLRDGYGNEITDKDVVYTYTKTDTSKPAALIKLALNPTSGADGYISESNTSITINSSSEFLEFTIDDNDKNPGEYVVTATVNDAVVDDINISVEVDPLAGYDTKLNTSNLSSTNSDNPNVTSSVTTYLALGTLPSDFTVGFNANNASDDIGASQAFYITVGDATVTVQPNGKYDSSTFIIKANGVIKTYVYNKATSSYVIAF